MDKPQRKWLVRHAGDHGIYDCTDDELFDVVERGPYGLITIAAEHDRDTARLIAAAPCMLEALRDLVADREEVAKRSWETWIGGECHWNDEIWERQGQGGGS
jgi:hypothetical protein